MAVRKVKYYFDIYKSTGELKFRKNDVRSASIDYKSLSALLYTAEVSMTEDSRIDYINDYLQISVNIDGVISPLGRYVMSSPDRLLENGQAIREIRCYSMLKIFKDEKLEEMLVLPAGTHITNEIKRMITGYANRIPELNYRLATQKVFPAGTEKLEVINEMLDTINYSRLLVDLSGIFYIQPYIAPSDRDTEITYVEGEARIIDSITEELDLDVPNVFVLATSNIDIDPPLVAVYKNQNPSSPVSIQARNGKKVTEFNTVDDVTDETVLNAKNKKIAYERTEIFSHVEFTTAVNPAHSYLNCIYLKAYDLNSKYIETGWSLDCKAGGEMEHTVRRAVQI